MSQLTPKEFEDLPPGGGLHAKKSLLEDVYNKYVLEKFPNSDENTFDNALESLS
jgi:hypothetical protein